jgi:hypothetical protein
MIAPLLFSLSIVTSDIESIRCAGQWLVQNVRPDGLFRYGFEPALDRDMEEENLVRQAGTAAALARAGVILGDIAMTGCAREVLARLMQLREKDRQSPLAARKKFAHKQGAHPVGWGALLLVGLAELEDLSPQEIQQGDAIASFLLSHQREDGSVRLVDLEDDGDDDGEIDEEGWAYYPGEALYALARWGVVRDQPALLERVSRSRLVYWKFWRQEKEPAFIPWQSAAHAEVFLATGEQASASMVLEMNDWLLGLQYDGKNSPASWVGGFGHYHEGERWATEPGIASASYAESLVEAVRVARQMKDAVREERYRQALDRAITFVGRLQYREGDLGHFAAAYRPKLVGAFFQAPFDGTVRIDFTQHALMAMGGRERLSASELPRAPVSTRAN